MHLKSLKVFCDVVGRRSFSRAAADNEMTQSGASQIVHHLEQYLGVKLIDRSKRPFVLTPEGKAFHEGCRDLVQKLYALEEAVRTLHEEVEGRVSVASIYSVGLSHMKRCVRDFLAAHSKASVRVEYQHPHRVSELVEAGQVDLGIVSYPRQTRMIKSLAWRHEPMVVVCAPDHFLAHQDQVMLADFDGIEMVGFDDGLRIRREIDKVFAGRGVHVRVVVEFDNIETLKRAVEINTGFSILPQPTVAREVRSGTLVTRRIADADMVRPLGIIHRSGVDLGVTARRFIQFLLDHPARDESAAIVADSHGDSDETACSGANERVVGTYPESSTAIRPAP